jgi:hypothetical protein
MNLTEWGREFPVTGSIQHLLDSIAHRFRPLTVVSRTLHAVSFLFDDSSVLILPFKFFQNSQYCQTLRAFIANPSLSPPEGKFFIQFDSPVIGFFSIDPTAESVPMVIVFKENGTYDIIRAGPETNYREDQNVALNLPQGQMRRIFVQNGMVAVIIEDDGHFFVYSARFSLFEPMNRWTLQCEVPGVCHLDIQPPVLYVLDGTGISGCAFDASSNRQFPRALTRIADGKFIRVRSFADFAVYNPENSQILVVRVRKMKRVSTLRSERNDFQELFLIGNRIFRLSPDLVEVIDAVSGETIRSETVWNTPRWITSFEPNYGAVFIGSRSFTISKTEIAPLINLRAPRGELLDLMKKAKDNIGSIAGAIVLMSDRSPYLAVSLAADDIAREVADPPAPGTIQATVRPVLSRINSLLQNKPE